MNANWISALILFGQNGDAGAGQGGGLPAQGGFESLLTSPLILLVMLVFLFYFVVMRPQRKEQAKRLEMLSNVKKNDRVVTIGGIYGVVTNVHREIDEVSIKVDESTNTKLRITLSSVARILGDETSEQEDSK